MQCIEFSWVASSRCFEASGGGFGPCVWQIDDVSMLRLGIGAVAWSLGLSGGLGSGAQCVVHWSYFFILFRRFPIAHMVSLYKFSIFTDLGK